METTAKIRISRSIQFFCPFFRCWYSWKISTAPRRRAYSYVVSWLSRSMIVLIILNFGDASMWKEVSLCSCSFRLGLNDTGLAHAGCGAEPLLSVRPPPHPPQFQSAFCLKTTAIDLTIFAPKQRQKSKPATNHEHPKTRVPVFPKCVLILRLVTFPRK